jgi:RNA recognition motif-containing protein
MRVPPFKGNIVVTNLPGDITPADLASLFDEFGLVLGAKIDRWHDRPGGSNGLVDLAPDTSVETAVAALHGRMVGSTKISVKRAVKKPVAAKRPAAAPVRRSVPANDHQSAPPPPSRAYVAMDKAAAAEYAAAAPTTRKVVVEYRPAPRRVVIPPRTASPSGH